MASADFSLLNSLLTRVGNSGTCQDKNKNQNEKTRRFLLVSTHAQQTTGYSKVSYNLVKELANSSAEIEIHHFGFQRFFDMGANYRPYPKEQGFG